MILDRPALEEEVGRRPGIVLLVEVEYSTESGGGKYSRPDNYEARERDMGGTLQWLDSSLPEQARIARYGGRLVAIWLPESGEKEAASLFLDLCSRQGEACFVAGVAPALEGGKWAARTLLDCADRALSRAREEGGWAVWDEERDRGRRRADPLAGIFSAEPPRTYRNTRLLLEIVEEVASARDLSSLLPSALDRILEVCGTERALLMLCGEDGELETALARDRSGQPVEMVEAYSRTIPRQVSDTGRTVCLTERERKTGRPVLASSIVQYELRTVLCVPLEAGGQCIGVLYTDGRLPQEALGPEDVAFIEAMGHQIALAIENTRLAEQERQRLESQVSALRQSVQGDCILGEHPSMNKILDQLATVAPGELTVLIHGASGSGKETQARALHARSARSGGPFVVLDCGALPESLIDGELFGHEKGAFSGADRQRKGILELAAGGTLFLDEVADLGLETQAKLLRVLADGSFRRLGGEEMLLLDARVLASTACDLAVRIESGLFRKDLYFRLKVVEIQLPPLVERGKDVLLLARHFAQVFGTKEIAVDAERFLLAHDWPGNVRELRHRMQRAVTLSQGPYLSAADLGLGADDSGQVDLKQARDEAKREVERDFVRKALSNTRGNVTQAAKELGLSRSRMNQILSDLAMDPNDFR